MAERKRNRPYTVDDVRFVYENYAEMTAGEIAEELGISKFQVAKIVSELRRQGVELPTKMIRRQNPILVFLKEIGVEPKQPQETKPRKGGRKKAS